MRINDRTYDHWKADADATHDGSGRPHNAYQRANFDRYHATNGKEGRPIDLGDRKGPFWSRGPRGCDACGGSGHEPARLTAYVVTRDGVTFMGMSCNGRPWGDGGETP